MAEENTEEEGGKKGGKMMVIIIVAVVVLLGGGAGAYFFLFAGGDEEVVEEEAVEAENQPQVSGEAIYVAMPRPFQFNAPGLTRERLVQIDVQLMVRGTENEDKARRHIPMLEGNLLTVFSASSADDLVTESGKKDLREKATAQVRQVMSELENDPVIEQVLFTGFVLQ